VSEQLPNPDDVTGGGSPLDSVLESDLAKEHPEALVGGAFVGAFLLAKLLKAIGR
jgi:hypothetical protein